MKSKTMLAAILLSGFITIIATASPAIAEEITLDFTNQGTFTTDVIQQNGTTITGSNTLKVLDLNGIGVVGGWSDNRIDGNESVTVMFDKPMYSVSSYGFIQNNLNGGNNGEVTIEAYNGNQVFGPMDIHSLALIEYNELLQVEQITGFKITANGDAVHIANINFNDTPPSSVSEMYDFDMEGFIYNDVNKKIQKATFHGTIIKNNDTSFMTDSVFTIGKRSVAVNFPIPFNFQHDVQFDLNGLIEDNANRFIFYNTTIHFNADDQIDNLGDDGFPVIFSIKGDIQTYFNSFYQHDFFMMGKSTQISPFP